MILPVQRATNKDGWTHPMEMTLGYESFPVQHSSFGGMTEVIRRHLQGQALKKILKSRAPLFVSEGGLSYMVNSLPQKDGSLRFDSKAADISETFGQILANLASRPKYLPDWPEGQRAIPNEILRSALFNCRNRKQPRLFMKDTEIALIGDGQVIYRGEELRQDDELVWLHLMHLMKKLPLGECVEFTPYSFVKAVGWPMKGQSYERLRVCLSRMQATAIRIQSKRLGCFISVSLILKFRSRDEQNENLSRWQVWVGEEMRLLFDEDFLTRLNWEIRKSLPDGIASKLFGYWATHRQPYPVKIVTLRQLCGSEMSTRHFKVELKKAVDLLCKIGFLETWEFKEDLVVVKRKY